MSGSKLLETHIVDCTVGAVAGQLAAAQRVAGFSHGATLCVIHKLLFRVWVSCVCELVCSDYNNKVEVMTVQKVEQQQQEAFNMT
uniref:SFRICE_004739 n=1 Tax=Spodoptera frugiperda TaxID=7108 RepID=A0A2H1UZX2_SPOFR